MLILPPFAVLDFWSAFVAHHLGQLATSLRDLSRTTATFRVGNVCAWWGPWRTEQGAYGMLKNFFERCLGSSATSVVLQLSFTVYAWRVSICVVVYLAFCINMMLKPTQTKSHLLLVLRLRYISRSNSFHWCRTCNSGH